MLHVGRSFVLFSDSGAIQSQSKTISVTGSTWTLEESIDATAVVGARMSPPIVVALPTPMCFTSGTVPTGTTSSAEMTASDT